MKTGQLHPNKEPFGSASFLSMPSVGSCEELIEDICHLNWSALSRDDLIDVAWVYYYFSVQFCENVGIARDLFPDDKSLEELDHGERNTDNLSPYPGVVADGEKVDHVEFMRRTLQLTPVSVDRRRRLEAIGEAYLTKVRAVDAMTRTMSLQSYEDGGLEKVFRTILSARQWDGALLLAFRHFLEGHIKLDSDPDHPHGSLCRHLKPTAGIRELWAAFRDSLTEGVPALMK
jgi:hypothetical protein